MSRDPPGDVIDPSMFNGDNSVITHTGVPVVDIETLVFIDEFYDLKNSSEQDLYETLTQGLSDNSNLLSLGIKVVKEFPKNKQWKIINPSLKMVYMIDLQTKFLFNVYKESTHYQQYSMLAKQSGVHKLREGLPIVPEEICDGIATFRDKHPGNFLDNVFDRMCSENDLLLNYIDDVVAKEGPITKADRAELYASMQAVMTTMYAAIDRTYNAIWSMNATSVFMRDVLRHCGQLSPNHAVYGLEPLISIKQRKQR